MESKILTLKGKLINYKGNTKYKYPFIRKMLDLSQKSFRNEVAIAKKIMKNPCDNVVNVLHINEGDEAFIDYQKVDTTINSDDPSKEESQILEKYNKDIKQGLLNLHKVNIIYIDLKFDNTGYDHFSNQWKIFDFDASGICSKDKMKWVVKPLDYAVYRFVKNCENNKFNNFEKHLSNKQREILGKICKKKNLLKFDEAIFFLTFNQKLY